MLALTSDTVVFLTRYKSYRLLTYLLVSIKHKKNRLIRKENGMKWEHACSDSQAISLHVGLTSDRLIWLLANNTSSQKEQSTKYQCRVHESITSAPEQPQVTKFMVVSL